MVQPTSSELLALQRAIEIAGSQSRLARLLDISQTSVWKMVNKAKRMSHEYVLKAEAATGVSRHALRPDLYPIENSGQSCSPEAAPAAAGSHAVGDRTSLPAGVRS